MWPPETTAPVRRLPPGAGVAQERFDGVEASDGGRANIDGEVLTGTLGADADWGRVLAGVAVSLSEGEGGFDRPGDRGSIESVLTTVNPYTRVRVTERLSAWGLAGWGTGDMAIRFDDGGAAPVRTDIGMRLGALGARGALMEQDGAGGMDLALKTDAFFVRMEADKTAGSAATTADASRVRLALEGGRTFALSETAVLRPRLQLGVRHDDGDAETGTGVELGGGVAWADAASGLSVEVRARMLAAHADSDYEEWGAGATARLDPGERGRGLSFSLAPVIGSAASASERVWGAHDARGLAPAGSGFEASRGLTAEGRLRAGAIRRPLHRHAEPGLRDVGRRRARLAPRLAVLLRTAALALAGYRNHPPRTRERQRGRQGRTRRDTHRRAVLVRAGCPVQPQGEAHRRLGAAWQPSDEAEAHAPERNDSVFDRQPGGARIGEGRPCVLAPEVEARQSLAAPVPGLDEAKPGIVERQREGASAVGLQRDFGNVAPAPGQPLRVRALQFGRQNRRDHAGPHMRLPVRPRRVPWPVLRFAALLAVDLEECPARIPGMKLHPLGNRHAPADWRLRTPSSATRRRRASKSGHCVMTM